MYILNKDAIYISLNNSGAQLGDNTKHNNIYIFE